MNLIDISFFSLQKQKVLVTVHVTLLSLITISCKRSVALLAMWKIVFCLLLLVRLLSNFYETFSLSLLLLEILMNLQDLLPGKFIIITRKF